MIAMRETKKFCEFMTRLGSENIPQEVVSDVRYRVLDWTGCAASAFKSDSAEKIFHTFAAACRIADIKFPFRPCDFFTVAVINNGTGRVNCKFAG